MKKTGFTLAEVLVTLGIIGVVAALTTPALIQNVGNAKVGPRLQKFQSTFETASEMMLTEENANTLASISKDGAELMNKLSKYMKMIDNDSTYEIYHLSGTQYATPTEDRVRYDTDDGVAIWFPKTITVNAVDRYFRDFYPDIPTNRNIGWLFVDINGEEGPNKVAKDVFCFLVYNDGSLIPYGAKDFARYNKNFSNANYWNQNDNCTENKVVNDLSCTGSIFENGMKIIYQ